MDRSQNTGHTSGHLPSPGALDEACPEARALYADATALSAARKHVEAVTAYRACLKANPGMALARVGLCESLLAAGDRESARAEAVPLEGLVPREEPTWRRAFSVLRKLGDQTRAEIVTRHFISEAGGTPEARIELVAMQPVPERQSRDRIETDLADALQHAAEEPLFWRRVAEQQRRLGRLGDALDAIEHALRIKPDDFAAGCERVEILIRQEKHRLARKHLAEIVPLAPDTARDWLQIAETAAEAHDAAIARHAIGRAIGLIDPEWHGPRLRLIRAMLAVEDERDIEAIRDLTAVCDDPKILRQLFTICYNKDYKEVALAAGEKLQRVATADYEITARLDSLRFVTARQKPTAGRAGRSAPGRGRRLLAGLFRGGRK